MGHYRQQRTATTACQLNKLTQCGLTIIFLVMMLVIPTTFAKQKHLIFVLNNEQNANMSPRSAKPTTTPTMEATRGSAKPSINTATSSAAAQQALELQLGQLIAQAISAKRGLEKDGSNDNPNLRNPFRESEWNMRRTSAATEPIAPVNQLNTREHTQDELILDRLLNASSQAYKQQQTAIRRMENRPPIFELAVDSDGGEEMRPADVDKLISSSSSLSSLLKPRERKRRTSMIPAGQQQRQLTAIDQQPNNAMQSLASTLLVWDLERAYKPKIISTARGFGKRSHW